MKIQPTAGSPETKEVNGRTWHWCGGCNRWLTTHGMATHKNKVKEGESPPDPAAVPPPIGAEVNAAAIRGDAIGGSLLPTLGFGGA